MHHLYPSVKGDPVCPLGFHPQVRWPTRCKRCLRDYKDHGGRKKQEDIRLRKDDSTASSPSLSVWGTVRNEDTTPKISASSIDISKNNSTKSNSISNKISDTPETTTSFLLRRPASWTSTPDLGALQETTSASVPTVSFSLPRRRLSTTTSTDTLTTSKSTSSSASSLSSPSSTSSSASSSTSSLSEKPSSITTRSKAKDEEPTKPKLKSATIRDRTNKYDSSASSVSSASSKLSSDSAARRLKAKEKAAADEPANKDVQFLIQVKQKSMNNKSVASDDNKVDDDASSMTGTETTDTTIIDRHEHDLQEQINSLQKELDMTKLRCEKAEREKSDILLKRLASKEITSSKTTASEVLKLQQRCNELQTQVEDLRDDKKCFSLKVKELESEISTRPSPQLVNKITDELKSKLLAAETLCEELMDENEDMKKELRNMEEEMEEMQDNFREDQADEYTSLKKELEQTTKNCRILSFKLRKNERKMEQVELDKQEANRKLKEVSDGQSILEKIERIEQLEQELRRSNEVSVRLQKELEEAKTKKTTEGAKTTVKKKAPMLASMKTDKMSRESLTRGGSQDDPIQLMRDLQDSLEREADLREQLKFAEEEAGSLRKKASRVEDDNESLVLQLKKMASQAKSRKPSPAPRKLTSELEKDEGISDDEDPSELRLLLELSEQEASVLRKKVEEMDMEADIMRRKMKDLQDKVNTKIVAKTTLNGSLTKSSSIEEQKVKVLEDETHDLRKKLIEKERDCERLYAELSVTQKRSKGMVKSKSLDLDQQTVDLKRQLEVVEQEAVVLRNKQQTLESENDKLLSENKRLSLVKGTKTLKSEKLKLDELRGSKTKLTDDLSNLQSGYTKVKETFDKLKEHLGKSRVAKKPTELTPRSLLKSWVIELEEELTQYTTLSQNIEKARKSLEDELKMSPNENKLMENEKFKTDPSQQYLEDENCKLKSENKSLKDDKNELKQQMESLNTSLEEAKKKQAESLKSISDNAQKNDEINSLKKNLEQLKKVETEKNSLDKQMTDKTNKITDLETRIKEMDEKVTKNEKLLNTRKDKITKLMKDLDVTKAKLKDKEADWQSEKSMLEATLESRNVTIEDLNRRESTVPSTLAELQNELSNLKTELIETKCNLENITKNKKVLEDTITKLESDSKSDTTNWKSKISDLESELKVEKKILDNLKTNHTSEQKTKESEISILKKDIQSLKQNIDENNSKLSNVKNDYEDRLSKSQKDIVNIKKEYDDLTARYEVLEEEYVVTKAKLVMEKEAITSQLHATREEFTKLDCDLQKVKLSYNREHDIWIQEKNALGEEIKELKKKYSSSSMSDTLTMERARLKALVEEKSTEIDQINNKYQVLEDQFTNVRKENEDLKSKLEDFDKVHKVQRNMNADSSALDKEVDQLRNKLKQVETTRKTDLIDCKLRYDTQIALVNKELQLVGNQVSKFKKERDAYKHMLDKTQRSLDELQTAKNRSGNIETAPGTNYDDAEEHKMKLTVLEQQISCLEDELSEARLESSKLKTELVSERSSWEVKLSEMHSKLNEMEEDRLINSGRTKIAGLRTRMELAWQREREEQTRLLQETSTLARDLRQTLFEVERERDKERLEAKRKQEQLRRTVEEEQEENRKKLNELQCDLLELRDAHAKLRTTNEKLRREKERNEKEREEFRTIANSKKKNDNDYDRCLANVLQQIEVLYNRLPELSKVYTPTPPRRMKSKSRESSPVHDLRRSNSREQIVNYDNNSRSDNRAPEDIQHVIFRLQDAAKELRQNRIQNISISKWAATSDHTGNSRQSMRVKPTSSLNRKSLSLEQTNELAAQEQIWKDNDSMSSLQSIGASSDTDSRFHSMDSRLSGGSTQSEMVGTEKKRKRGIIGKLKQLGKSRSIDDPNYTSVSRAGSVTSDDGQESNKRDLKDRITGMFKRSGSSSRSNSVERSNKSKTDSQNFTSAHRPLMRNGRNESGSSIN